MDGLIIPSPLLTPLLLKGIPVCVLNACQSGKQLKPPSTSSPPIPPTLGGEEEEQEVQNPPELGDLGGDYSRETSLGSRLMGAGMQMVVAMGYSVTVTAASLLMETIYKQLFAEKGITEVLRLGRKELYNRKGRRAYYN